MAQSLNTIFKTFEDHIQQYYQQVKADCVPFAKLLPFFVKEANMMHTPTYSQAIMDDPLLRMLNMSIYTSFDQYHAE